MGDTIYHYTNTEGLVGILSNQTLRLSDYRSLNDSSEIQYAFEVISEVIDGTDEPTSSLLRSSEYEKVMANLPIDPVLVSSFSASSDNPVLWRLYSKGRGYVIGIDKQQLEISSKSLQNAKFGNVIYNKDKQLEFIRDKLAQFLESNRIDHNSHNNEYDRKLDQTFRRINFFFWLHQVAPFVKSDAFEHEQEWRISAHIRNPSELEFRTRSEDIIPYIDMKLHTENNDLPTKKSLWLKSITMGPRVDSVRVMPQIYSLLQYSRINPNKVMFYKNKFPI